MCASVHNTWRVTSSVKTTSTLNVCLLPSNAGDDLAKAVPKFDKERLPDAHGLVDIESSFSKLVGNKFKAILDLKFLKIVVHVVFGGCLRVSV